MNPKTSQNPPKTSQIVSSSGVLERIDLLSAERHGALWLHRHRGHRFLFHHHDELEWNLVVAGSATYLVGERQFRLTRRTQIWLFPAQNHVLIEQSNDLEIWIAVFRPNFVAKMCSSPASQILGEVDPQGEWCRRLHEPDFARLSALSQEIASAADADFINAGLGFTLLTAWQAHQNSAQNLSGSEVSPAVERAARILRDEGPLGVPQLARRVGLSPSRLSRLFKIQTGTSLTDFRNRQCLERFFQIFGEGQRLNLTEAAHEAGFGSYAQFHRIFRAQTGQSPAQFRRLTNSPDAPPNGRP